MSKLTLDHIFILMENQAINAEQLIQFGLKESISREHKGQGTSNRRFEFTNGMLECLYLRDKHEAENGPGKNLNLVSRVEKNQACKFGLVFTCDEFESVDYEDWQYWPDYFKASEYIKESMHFKILGDSQNIADPLMILSPFTKKDNLIKTQEEFTWISKVKITLPNISKKIDVLQEKIQGVELIQGNEFLIELELDDNKQSKQQDFRPDIDLIIRY